MKSLIVYSHLRFITRLQLPLGSRMGCVSIFAIAIPIHPVEKNRHRVKNRTCE